MLQFLKLTRYVLFAGLAAGAGACLWMGSSDPRHPAHAWLQLIVFGGFVGMAAVTITVRMLFMKMLFHPKKPSLFGLQGAVPGNMPLIAAKVAGEAEILLSPEVVLQHIEQQGIIGESIDAGMDALRDFVTRKTDCDPFADTALGLYKQYRDTITCWLSREAKGWVSDLMSRTAAAGGLLQAVKPAITQFLESEALKQNAREWIMHEVIEKSPELFFSICSQISGRLTETQAPWKKMALSVMGLSGLDKNGVQDLMRQILESPETYDQATQFIEKNIHHLEALLEQGAAQQQLARFSGWLDNAALDESSIRVLDEKIESFLKDDASRQIIEGYLLSLIDAMQSGLKSYLCGPEGIEAIRALTTYIIPRLKIRQFVEEKIKSRDIDILEQNMKEVSGPYVTALEVCGGVLGMLAGLAAKIMQLQ